MARLSAKTGLLGLLWGTCIFCLYIMYQPNEPYTGVTIQSNHSSTVSVQRLSSKLEYLNGELMEKKQELSLIREKISQIEHSNDHSPRQDMDVGNSTKDLVLAQHVPSLFQLMPHLEHNASLLHPQAKYGHSKSNVEMVLAVPHVHRDKQDYLQATLTSLFTQMNAEERSKVVIVVVVAEPFNNTEFNVVSKMASTQFASQVNSGNLEIIQPSAKWYPDLDNLPEKWGDKPDRAKWRTKQNLDYAFMMLYCSHIGELYVQLEDDISAKPNYIKQMKQYAASQDRWELLEFSQLGFIGKMFKSSMLPRFVSFILMFYKHKPVDWLLDNYFWVQECHGKSCSDLSKIRKRFRPSLFQHEGYHSSLAGKVQKLRDKDFNKKGSANQNPVIYAHRNPGAVVETSLKPYQQFTLQKCYDGVSIFWALNPQPNDHITVRFKQPTKLKSYKVVSGDSQHKDDRLLNATIGFLPVSANVAHPPHSFLLDQSGFVAFQFFNTTAHRSEDDPTIYTMAEGVVPPEFGLVSAARIVSHSESQNWMIISELWFVT